MDINAWLADYVGEAPTTENTLPTTSPSLASTSIQAPPKPRKGSPRKNTKPWYPPFPATSVIAAMRLQLFDNPNPGTGKSRYALKIRAYYDTGSARLDQYKPDWERPIGLLDPKKVEAWALARHAEGTLTDLQLDRYQSAANEVRQWAQDPQSDLALMGHIGSPPGTHYFPGQFVSLCSTTGSEVTAALHIDGDVVTVDRFFPNKRARKANAPTFYGLYDPHGLIAGKSEEADDDR